MKLTDQELMEEFKTNPNLCKILVDDKSPEEIRQILKSGHEWLLTEESKVSGWLYQRQIMANQLQRQKTDKEEK